MHKTIFIMTHVGSGWEGLVEALHRSPRVHCFTTGKHYQHPEDVRELTALPHRRAGAAAVWADVILHNKDFAMKRLCQYYKLVFWVGARERAVDELVRLGYGWEQAEDYYDLRLAGLEEYHRRCPASPWNPSLEGDALLGAVL